MEIHIDEESQQQLKGSLYARTVTQAVMQLGQVVEIVINLRDVAVLDELERVTRDIFEQARAALDDEKGKVQ
jgi:hypothetical protein